MEPVAARLPRQSGSHHCAKPCFSASAFWQLPHSRYFCAAPLRLRAAQKHSHYLASLPLRTGLVAQKQAHCQRAEACLPFRSGLASRTGSHPRCPSSFIPPRLDLTSSRSTLEGISRTQTTSRSIYRTMSSPWHSIHRAGHTLSLSAPDSTS